MTPEQIISQKPRFLRATPTKGAQPRVDRNGGDYGAGVIRNAALVTEGEALGHRMWLDRSFVEGVHESVKATGTKGLKMRFTHPGLSSDGMGSFLGRGKGGMTKDGITYADIHFAKSAHKTPDGDLAEYVMNLAEEDPEAFGTSIVFEPDYGAEERFVSENKDEDGRYHSPDPNNLKNYPHARLARLRAADVVDEPAANPGGLFHRGQSIADEADRLLSFSLGLSSERPEMCHLSIDPDRAAAFVARFLNSHGLEIKETDMSEKESISKEDFDAFMTLSEEKSAALEAKITALSAQVPASDDAPKSYEDGLKEGRIEGRKDATSIFAFASFNSLDFKSAEEAVLKGQSVETFKASITDRLIAGNGLTKDSGQQDEDQDAKYKAEYRAQLAAFTAMGLTEAEYIVSRKIDDKKENLCHAA